MPSANTAATAKAATPTPCTGRWYSTGPLVRDTFPEAWGKPATESRLMHSAGIRAMGALMDQVMLRADSSPQPEAEIRAALSRLAPHCCWVDGVWEELGWRWNEVQTTRQHITRLSDLLIRLDRELARRGG